MTMTMNDVARKIRSHADFVGSLGGSGELLDSVELGELADAIDSHLMASTLSEFSVQVTAELMDEVITSMQGPDGEGCSGTLWVGRLDDCGPDGSSRYGIHISCNECPEEGSVTLAEFDAPKAVAQGEAVASGVWEEFGSEMWVTALNKIYGCRSGEGIYHRVKLLDYQRKHGFADPAELATPTIPTGHRVVADGLAKDAARYQWLRDRVCVRWEMALDGEKHEALGMRPGFGFLRSTMDPAKGWTLPEFFDDHRQKTDNAIDKAMLAAAPDAGGV